MCWTGTIIARYYFVSIEVIDIPYLKVEVARDKNTPLILQAFAKFNQPFLAVLLLAMSPGVDLLP